MNNLSLLVSSCDKYSFLWPDFVYFFRKNWDKNLNIPIYFISEDKPFTEDPDFINVQYGKGTYSDCLRKALKSMDTDYVFYLQDDYFLTKAIGKDWVEHLLLLMRDNNLDRITFQGIGKNISVDETDTLDNGKLKRMLQDSRYTVSMQPGIWNRRFFFICLSNVKESPWEFEKYGSKRLNSIYNHRLYINDRDKDLCPSSGVMKGGKCRPSYYRLLERKAQETKQNNE